MNTAKQQITEYLEEAQGIVKAVEREGRQITKAERARAEYVLERVQNLKDTEALTEAINKMNGSLILGGFPSKSRGVPALDFSMGQVQLWHKAAQDGHFIKAEIDSSEAPMSTQPDYRLTPFPFLRDKPRVAVSSPWSEPTRPPSITSGALRRRRQRRQWPKARPSRSRARCGLKYQHRSESWLISSEINDEVLQDFSNFRAVIGTELLAGLIDAENAQLLVGSGVSPNLTGLLTTSGILTRARAADSSLDAIAKAKSDLRTGASFTEPDAIVIHPTNLNTIQTAKDTTGRYIVNDPAAPGPEQLFGMRVVATTKITLNTALMGNLLGGGENLCAPASGRGARPPRRWHD